ncbi:MAG: hypothetical protein ABEK36_06190 [Candidatus Aenigmatarchaeota archaeon]
MENMSKKVYEKIKSEMQKLTKREAKEWENNDCGRCTGDKQYNDNYMSEVYETENYKLIDSSCRTTLHSKNCDVIENSEIDVWTLTTQEQIELLRKIKKEVQEKLEQEKELKAELQKEL